MKADPIVPHQTDDGGDPINLIFYGDADAFHAWYLLFSYFGRHDVGNCYNPFDPLYLHVNGNNPASIARYPNSLLNDSGCFCNSSECMTHIRIWNMGSDPNWGTWSVAGVHKEHWNGLSHTIDSWEDAETMVRTEMQAIIPCEVSSVDTYWLGNNQNYQNVPNNGYATRVKLVPLGSGPPCGGSVASGTLITLADGSRGPVQNLDVGTKILSVDTEKNQYAVSTITRTAVVNTHDQLVIRTEKGLPLRTDNANQQKLWVRKDDRSGGWLSVTKVRIGDYLLDALDESWVRITGIEYITGSFTMYDIYGTAPYNYIANGYLDPFKEGPSG